VKSVKTLAGAVLPDVSLITSVPVGAGLFSFVQVLADANAAPRAFGTSVNTAVIH
jgi:hypothetical protein